MPFWFASLLSCAITCQDAEHSVPTTDNSEPANKSYHKAQSWTRDVYLCLCLQREPSASACDGGTPSLAAESLQAGEHELETLLNGTLVFNNLLLNPGLFHFRYQSLCVLDA